MEMQQVLCSSAERIVRMHFVKSHVSPLSDREHDNMWCALNQQQMLPLWLLMKPGMEDCQGDSFSSTDSPADAS